METWYTIAMLIFGGYLALTGGFLYFCYRLKQINKKLTWSIEEVPDDELGEDAIRLVHNR